MRSGPSMYSLCRESIVAIQQCSSREIGMVRGIEFSGLGLGKERDSALVIFAHHRLVSPFREKSEHTVPLRCIQIDQKATFDSCQTILIK